MKIECAYDEIVDVTTLVPNPRNPNKHPPKQIELLAKIMKHQGVRSPIVVSNRSGFITKGHGRLEAIKLNGWQTAAIDRQDYASEADEYADMVADNKIAELAESDMGMVIEDVLKFPEMDLDLLGIPDFELPKQFDPGADEDEVPEHVEPKTKPGDLYLLGNHRLLCGDSTNIQHVERLMNGEKADMVFTDPPYGMNLETDYKNKAYSKYDFSKNSAKRDQPIRSYRPVIGDDQDFDPGIVFGFFENCPEVFLWGADYYCQSLPKNGSWIVWDKTGGHESLDKSGFGSNFELCWSRISHKRDIARITYKGVAGMKKEDGNRVHPTQKPVGLAQWFLDRWGKDKLNVVDIFGGSGSTLIACEKTNRKCFMMELDPHYVDVIVARWEKYTGQKAKLVSQNTDKNTDGE